MDDRVLGVLLALFVIVPCVLALARRKLVLMELGAWPELARRTGLSYSPPSRPKQWWADGVFPPTVCGEYRGRYVSMFVTGFGSERPTVGPSASMMLNVDNGARFLLSIEERGSLDPVRQLSKLSGGTPALESRFRIRGSPLEYEQRTAELIAHADPELLAWMLRSSLSIELSPTSLTCRLNSEIADADGQIALLDLLCDVADLAQRMARVFGEVEPQRSG